MPEQKSTNDPRLVQTILDDFRRGDFKSTVKQDYEELKDFYINEERRKRLQTMNGFKRFFYSAGWLLKELFLKLTPARRILLIVGLVLLLSNKQGDQNNLVLVGSLLLLFIIMLVYSYFYPSTDLKVGLSIVKGPFIPILTAIFGISSFFALRKSLHFFILNILGFTIFYLVLGVLGYDWYIMEIAALFLAMGVFTGFAAGKKNSEITRLFQEGVKDIVSAALVVGFAGGIIAILNDGQIIDTVLYSLSNSLKDTGQIAAISIMYGFMSLLNLIITSGSAKAALTIPIMAQFSDIIGLSRQATIMAFQFGAGITDMIAPTSGVLIGVLGIAKVPYGKWVKFVIPFMLFLAFVAWLLLIPTVTMKLNGF